MSQRHFLNTCPGLVGGARGGGGVGEGGAAAHVCRGAGGVGPWTGEATMKGAEAEEGLGSCAFRGLFES